jgi:type I restriction enzyme S subunit
VSNLPTEGRHPIGDAWLGDVPDDWSVVALRRLASLYSGGTPDTENRDYWENGTIPWLNSGAVNQRLITEPSAFITEEGYENSSAKWVPKGALVMALAGQGKTKGMVAQVGIEATCNQSMAAIVPTEKVHPRFLLSWLSANYETIRNLAGGEQRDGLNLEIVGAIPCPVPPFEKQRAIADYLDRETARMEVLITAKEELLELLAEKRRAIVAGYVTRGIKPEVPRRESGIPWLGKIPAHWEVERSKWLFRERDERSVTGEEEMLSVSHLTGVTPRSEKEVNMFEAETNEGYKICHAGDLVINTLWAWMGAMGVSPIDGIVSPAYNVYVPCERLYPAYVDAVVRIRQFAEEATRFSKGVWSSRLRLYPEGFFEIWMPVPPIDEQRAILAQLASETAKLEALRVAAERTIGLLKERRGALIGSAVRGQIQVVGAA